MSDCISKDEILSPDDYGFLYGQLECNKIPADIYDKIMEGDEFTEEEERRIKDIIEKEKAKIQEERKKGIKEYVEVDKTDYYDLKGKKLFSEMDTADSKMVLEPSEEV